MKARLKWRRLGRFAFLCSMASLVLWLSVVSSLRMPRAAQAAPYAQDVTMGDSRNVLLLNSYHDGLSWTDSMVAAVRSVLLDPARNPLAENTELYVEYMDTKRIAMSEAVEARWRAYLMDKYASLPLDVILVSDNEAYDFLRHAAAELFPDTPVVFCGINFFKDEDLEFRDTGGQALADRFTGVVEKVDFLSTLQVALRMHPNVKRIVVVNDVTPTGQLVQQELKAVVSSFEGITFEMLLNPTLADLGKLRSLPDDTLVLLVLLTRDGDGRFYTYEQSIDLLATLADRPIYGVWDFYLGHGLVGGMLTNAALQGEVAGEMVVQLLNGASVQDVPIVRESPNRYMFDYEQLRRFGVALSMVPDARQTVGLEETLVLNPPLPFYKAYGPVIGVGLGAWILASGVLLLQRSNLRKQRTAAAALQSANVALEDAHASMEIQVAARTEELERRSRQFQIAAAVAREVAGGALGGQDAAETAQGTGSLLERVAVLISEAFGFYHVGVFLVDEVGEFAVLRAASSPGGKAMAARGHRLRLGGAGRASGQGIVGYVAGSGESRIALDVGRDALWRQASELRETQSEMALPLKIRGADGDKTKSWIIGVLDVQSRERGAFLQDDVEVLEIVADQLALAIQISRLFEESRSAVERLEEAYGERVRAPWHRPRIARAYGFDGVAVRRLTQLAGTGEANVEAASDRCDAGVSEPLEVPILLRGDVVGTIMLERDVKTRPWLPEERGLAEAIGLQAGLSLENAQLLGESQMQAHRQEVLSDISSRMRETLDVDFILQTALREMGQRLGIAAIEVRMRGGSND